MIEHKTVSLADQVFEHLETDILSGKYQKGEILTEEYAGAYIVSSEYQRGLISFQRNGINYIISSETGNTVIDALKTTVRARQLCYNKCITGAANSFISGMIKSVSIILMETVLMHWQYPMKTADYNRQDL